jgi:carbamoyltransferase
MLTLGINCAWHDSSVAIVDDRQVLFACAEERLSRVKHDSAFPRLALKEALRHAGASIEDVDDVAFGWNRPGVHETYLAASIATGRIPYATRNLLAHLALIGRARYRLDGKRDLIRLFGSGKTTAKARFIDHHEAHAWSAFALSGFDDAAVLVVDGHGAWQATSIYSARDGVLKRLQTIAYPNSLGSFYTAFTNLLGFEANSDEWKVMGLAAYAEPGPDLSEIIQFTEAGYHVNKHALSVSLGGPQFLQSRFGPRRNPEDGFTDYDKALAASVQSATEQAMLALVRQAVHLTGCKRLCLAGGVAMNSKANGVILRSGLVDEIFVQPAATDDGTALGAAIAGQRRLGGWKSSSRMDHAYLGPGFSQEEIARVLADSRVAFTKTADVEAVTAQLIADGHVIGWFQGRMEFGPRALGARSILADPRDAAVRDRVNASVKFREEWRPFAPSCLRERASEYFEPDADSPFMILTFTVKPDKRDVIPAVTHVDGSARVQTVTKQANPRYWKLIAEFDRITGVPVVLNTSFNLKGEPIVCSPQDALRTFFTSGLDFLVMGDAIVAKDDVRNKLEYVLESLSEIGAGARVG